MHLQIPDFTQARVLIVGDVMLDRYWSGDALRISPEAPVPVVHIQQTEERPGGAGNVALNTAALGSHTRLMGICGADSAGDLLEEKLLAANVQCFFQRMANSPTIAKLRILSLHQQLIRLDFEEPFRAIDSHSFISLFKKQLSQSNIVILSDYAKGCLNEAPEMIRLAREANIPIFIDPKGNDFSIYRGASLLTPNRKEFETIVGACPDEETLIRKGQELLLAHDIGALLITRGEQGMTLIRANCPELHIPARAREVYDVTGAGDTVIAVLAAAYASHPDLVQATYIANLAAGIVVGKLGAATVNVPVLRRSIHQEYSTGRGIMTEEQLTIAISDAHAHGERIVMTGGCFDILHAGHIAYLEEAKSFGDRLIVAVNSDESVARLKGRDRPINSLKKRMTVLAALNAVDWVVPFHEDTPERIVSHLLPDVWVKGGDYRVEDLPEAKPVLNNGGMVKILQFVDGCSTSKVIEKIKSEVD